MVLGLQLHKGERFKDNIGNVTTFLDYDHASGCLFFELSDSLIEFSMPLQLFWNQYCLGIIMEVCDGPVAKDLV